MSIASRITSIENHIEEAYTEISRLGVDLTNVDKNIDNIADMLQEAYENTPKVTGEGSSLSLTPTRKGGLTIIPKGACEQDSYSGKNLLNIIDFESQTISGVTFTRNNDGSITISGTATANIVFRKPITFTLLKTITYTFSKNISTAYAFAISLRTSDESIISDTSLDSGTASTTFTPSANIWANYFQIYVNSGKTVNTTIYPMLEVGSTATDWEPYVGGIPSPNPDYPQDIRVVTDNLPVEYQEVEYIESSGAQYIDTGFNGGNNYSIKFKIFDNTLSKFQFSDLNSSVANENIGWYSMSSSKYGVYHTSTNNVTNISTGKVIEVDLKLSSTGLSCIYKGEVTSINYTPVTTNGNVVLFRRGNLDQYYSSTKLYYFKIYNSSNVLVRDLVPCYRISDNVIGLYDKANNVFYTNQGTGSFTKGNDVNKVVVQNKNLLSSIELGGIDTNTGDSQVSYSYARCDYIQVIGGETISVQYKDDSIERGQVVIYEYDKDKNFLGFHNGNAKTYSRTLLSNTAYIRLRLEGNNSSTLNEFYEYQVEYGETPTTYIAHAEQTLPLHLGANYLAGIGDYKDEIVGKTDEWKIVRNMAKNRVQPSQHSGSGNVLEEHGFRSSQRLPEPPSSFNVLLCTHLGRANNYNEVVNINNNTPNLIGYGATGQILCNISGYTTSRQYLDFFDNNNVTIYSPLKTPVAIPITDTTLINDLNNMYQAMGYDGTTNITITSDSNNAQMTASVSALKGE